VRAVFRSKDAPTLANYGLDERSLYTLQKRFMRQTAAIRRPALLLAVFVLVLGLGLGAYLVTRDSEDTASREPVGSTATGSRPQPPPPPIVAGPHNRPVPILMYHVVGPTPPGAALPGLYVSREDFAGQLRWLADRGYHAVTLRDVYRYWRGRKPLPSLPIVLSFDDGYREQFTIAAPLLAEHHWPAVLNLEYAHLVHEDLTGPMIRRMLADGWELDSHTLTHPDLTAVDAATLRREVTRSRQLLRRRFGVPVEFFCYPGGSFDARVVDAVRAAGYLGATTTQPGLARPSEPFTMARIRVNAGDGPRELAKKLAEAR
jgi:peptidoglycan/xylan/chitin deacetylase (PgdA/CDA1 family)